MTWELHRGNARTLDMIEDETVDLIVTSPPYFGQRSYQDGGEHYDGQLGSEPTPQEFLDALWDVTKACWRVLKPTGSLFVNLGDKRSRSGAPGTTSGLRGRRPDGTPIPGQVQGDRFAGATEGARRPRRGQEHDNEPRAARGYPAAAFGRPKSKQLLPHRYAIGCEDGLADPDGIGWVVRSDLVWNKPNGMPEPTTDRVRDSHEYWFHLAKSGRYFSSIDEIREPHSGGTHSRRADGGLAPKAAKEIAAGVRREGGRFTETSFNPLGKLPGSVWTVATEPLTVPDELGVGHFAAFPSEWPRRLILGWSPSGICVECDQARLPIVHKELIENREPPTPGRPKKQDLDHGQDLVNGWNGPGYPQGSHQVHITGYSCACATVDAPTRPAVVLDPFCGTGTTVMVAHALGRHGIGVDLSADYLRLAEWRVTNDTRASKVRERTNAARQGVLL